MDQTDLLQLYLDAEQARQTGDGPRAKEFYHKILAVQPTAEIWVNLGQILASEGDLAAALDHFEQAVTLTPDFALGWYNIGFAHTSLRNWDLAKAALQKTIDLDPKLAPAYFVFGNILRAQGDLNGAIAYYKLSLDHDDQSAQAWNNLGTSLHELHQTRAAADALLNAIKIDAAMPMPHMNLGLLLMEIGQHEGAKNLLLRALELQPHYPEAHNNLGSLLSQQGQHAEAMFHYRMALIQRPDFKETHSNLLFCILHKDGTDLAEVAALHKEWFDVHGAPHATRQAFANPADPARRLKIGFVSGDFRNHPVGFFTVSTIEDLARHPGFEVYLYANQYDEDAMTARFKASGAQWRNVWSDTDDGLVSRIKADEIDILCDLTGHNDRHRMGVFARRAAPVQVTWAGYMATTGLPSMDWLLGDQYQTPAVDQPFYTERLYQLPHSFICYTPPETAPDPAPHTPALDNGFITFGCFNKPAKISARAIGLWVRILNALPDAKILMKFSGLSDPQTADFFRTQFAAAGLDPARLVMEGVSPHRELLARYNAIDIALDPVPYTGSTTTLEALWMGVPLVTLPGAIFPARHAYGYLMTVGLPELVARDEDDYVEKVIALARDLPRLDSYRQNLRAQMRQSPLCDAAGFVNDFASALRVIWQDWCKRQTYDIISS